MTKRKILLHLDTDRHPSVFDRVVAIDAGAEEIMSYGEVSSDDVEPLVHGAIFTRGPDTLNNTAIFVGGRNVARAEELFSAVSRTFFGPLRTSVMLDPNGANTTAAAAVLAAGRHLDLEHTKALVLGGTGPVGQRLGLLLARQGAAVWLGSRTLDRAADAIDHIHEKYPDAHLFPAAIDDPASISHHPERFHLLLAAGAAGVRLVSQASLRNHTGLKVLIDLNAVPPTGIEGVEVTDHGREAKGIFHYGALGAGRLKMKIHKAAVAQLFQRTDQLLDAEQIFQIGQRLESSH